jgi:tRNA-binding protein
MVESPFETEFRVGTVTDAQPFPETRKPEMAKLWVDLGGEEVQSAAQLGYNHDVESLVGRQVVCATSLGTVNIAGFESEALTVGVPDEDGHPVLVVPDHEVPDGGTLY